jgi:predicted DCC family thiol-disulfide oxidoreductase YuxK
MEGNHMKKLEEITVYYNSACPICDAGIAKQKELTASCDITWVDVHTTPATAKELGIDIELIRERLHVRDETGKINVGASAMATLWRRTPSQKWFAKVMQLPAINWFTEKSYNLFAKALYRWNRVLKHW